MTNTMVEPKARKLAYGEHRKGAVHSDETRRLMREAWARRKEQGSQSSIAGLSSETISERWIAYTEGRGPYPFKKQSDPEPTDD